MARGAVPGSHRMEAPKHGHGKHGKKGGKAHLRRIEIEPTMNGGYVAIHYKHNSGNGPYQEPETHAFSNGKDLHAHLQQHIPDDAEEQAEGDE